MDLNGNAQITELLRAIRSGDRDAQSQLAGLVYEQLRRIARSRMRGERPDHTLQPTALVNEAYMQLVAQKDKSWQNRTHFFAVAAQLMRRILIDYARAVQAQKRGGGFEEAPLEVDIPVAAENYEELLSVDTALVRLKELDARQATVVELRFFGGLTEDEVAEVLGVGLRTVKRDWNMARAFLREHMSGAAPRWQR